MGYRDVPESHIEDLVVISLSSTGLSKHEPLGLIGTHRYRSLYHWNQRYVLDKSPRFRLAMITVFSAYARKSVGDMG